MRALCGHPSGAAPDFPAEDVERSVPERFEAQARRHHDRLAVRTRSRGVSYGELNRAANRVAHTVLAASTAEVAALLVSDAAAFVEASLGLFKAGKVQVPLEGTFPRPRLEYMLEQSGAEVIVAGGDLALARELAGPRRRVVDLDALGAGASTADPGLPLGPDSLAAIEYTSGSTGRPKGILRSHRGVLHDVMRHTLMSRLCPHDRFTLSGRSAVNSLHALLNGAAFYPMARRPDEVARLAPWLVDERVTVYRSAVSTFRLLVSSFTGRETFPDLRLVVLFGEPVSERDVELHRQHFPETCLLVSTLGTSEFGDFSHFFVDRHASLPGGVVPAGYPAEGVEVLLLDETGAPAAGPEAVGEIAVKSRFGATGYWRMPELTAEMFIGDAGGDGPRVYRTGDMGRKTEDGCVFHLGRKDFQVKIHGNRVHVSEVEAALLAHEAVKAAAVAGREVAPGDVRLVAYVVPRGDRPPTASALRQALGASLPSFMVPSQYVTLDTLPLTATGKIDRRALPPPDGVRPELDTPYVAPRTPVEHALTLIWAEVLRVQPVGVTDHFLELGGDSLLATQIVSRVLEQFALLLAPNALLEAGTVAEMAEMVVEALAGEADERGLASALAELERSRPPGSVADAPGAGDEYV